MARSLARGRPGGGRLRPAIRRHRSRYRAPARTAGPSRWRSRRRRAARRSPGPQRRGVGVELARDAGVGVGDPGQVDGAACSKVADGPADAAARRPKVEPCAVRHGHLGDPGDRELRARLEREQRVHRPQEREVGRDRDQPVVGAHGRPVEPDQPLEPVAAGDRPGEAEGRAHAGALAERVDGHRAAPSVTVVAQRGPRRLERVGARRDRRQALVPAARALAAELGILGGPGLFRSGPLWRSVRHEPLAPGHAVLEVDDPATELGGDDQSKIGRGELDAIHRSRSRLRPDARSRHQPSAAVARGRAPTGPGGTARRRPPRRAGGPARRADRTAPRRAGSSRS